jgi:hypothetical protein
MDSECGLLLHALHRPRSQGAGGLSVIKKTKVRNMMAMPNQVAAQ